MNTSSPRQWWIDHLGAEADPSGGWTLGPARQQQYGAASGQAAELTLHSFGSDLTASWFRPDNALPGALVLIPFYDAPPLFGLPSARTTLRGRDPNRGAHGSRLAEAGLSVLAVPWWFEHVAASDPATATAGSLQSRYSGAAEQHHRTMAVTALGRSLADLMLAVTAAHQEGLVGATGKLGVYGHSLGGKLAGHLAALDPRIDATVAHEAGWGFANSNWEAPWYFDEQIPTDRDQDDLLALIAPRPLLVAGGGDGDGEHNRDLIERAGAAWPEDASLELLLHNGGHPVPPHVLSGCAAWLRSRLCE